MLTKAGVASNNSETRNKVLHNFTSTMLELSSMSFCLLKMDSFLVLDMNTVAEMLDHGVTSYISSSLDERFIKHVMKYTLSTEPSPFILKDVKRVVLKRILSMK